MSQLRAPLSLSDLDLALTLWPEWSYAIAGMEDHLPEPFCSMEREDLEQYLKRVENRSWCRRSMVGRWLMIHAGATIGGGQFRQVDAIEAVKDMAFTAMEAEIEIDPRNIVTSAVVAVARIEGFVQRRGTHPVYHRGVLSQFEPMKLSPKWWVEEEIGWLLSDVVRLPQPVRCGGAQGLWRPAEEIRLQVFEGTQLATR